MEIIKWLQEWVAENCDVNWEHSEGVKIFTLDNPGWKVDITLEGTIAEGKQFTPIKIERSEMDWIHCNVQDRTFRGFCGIDNLNELLLIFKEWIES